MNASSSSNAVEHAAAPDVAAIWSGVASAWDTGVDYVEQHTAAATDAMLDALAIRPGARVLELGCGPGSLGDRLSGLAGNGGRVVLSDVAPGMVEAARCRNAQLANVDVEVLDALSTGLPTGTFDVVLSRMALMFVPEPTGALTEIHRVLTEDGRFAAMTWAGAEHNPWMTCVGMAVAMNGLTPGVLPMEPGGVFSLADPAALEAMVSGAGFRDVAVSAHDVVFRAANADEHIQNVRSLAGPLAAVLYSAPPEVQDAVRRTAAELLAPHVEADGSVAAPGRALLLHGRR